VNSALPVLTKVLQYGSILGVVLAVLGAVIGFLVDGGTGLVSGLIGAAMAFVFLAVTAASILLAARLAHNDFLNPVFFIVVLGGWLLKFAVFLVLLLLLKDQPWINPVVLLLTVIVGIIGSLVVDMIVIARSRQPYVDVRLPGDPTTPAV
jgi:drug/metabolite transporter (DMT)-like permease